MANSWASLTTFFVSGGHLVPGKTRQLAGAGKTVEGEFRVHDEATISAKFVVGGPRSVLMNVVQYSVTLASYILLFIVNIYICQLTYTRGPPNKLLHLAK